MKLGRVVAHIPARRGSKRVPAKNRRYLAGKPMIAYAIDAALKSDLFEKVYVNTDCEILAALGTQLGCDVYRRPPHLATDEAQGDEFTIDFINHVALDTLVMISPVCPLVEADDIREMLRAFDDSDADTAITCTITKLQTFYGDRPVNINPNARIQPTQLNQPITICNWAVTAWNADKFREHYAAFQGGYFGQRRIFWPLDSLRAVKISDESDFRVAEALLLSRRTTPPDSEPRYWDVSDGVGFLSTEAGQAR